MVGGRARRALRREAPARAPAGARAPSAGSGGHTRLAPCCQWAAPRGRAPRTRRAAAAPKSAAARRAGARLRVQTCAQCRGARMPLGHQSQTECAPTHAPGHVAPRPSRPYSAPPCCARPRQRGPARPAARPAAPPLKGLAARWRLSPSPPPRAATRRAGARPRRRAAPAATPSRHRAGPGRGRGNHSGPPVATRQRKATVMQTCSVHNTALPPGPRHTNTP